MSKQPKIERPPRPKELSHRNVVDYVDKVLRLENDDQEVIRIKYNKIHNATTRMTCVEEWGRKCILYPATRRYHQYRNIIFRCM